MKKTDSFMKVVVLVICVMVVVYLGYSILRTPQGSYTTYKAVHYEVGDGISTSGFVVRQEKLVLSGRSIVVLTCDEGDRVSAGQSVANSYNSEEARRRQMQLSSLKAELSQMEYAYSYSGVNTGTLDADIVKSIRSVNTLVARQEYSSLSSESEQLKSFVLRRHITASDAETLWSRILETREKIAALEAEAADQAEPITVDEAGYFSGKADGFEGYLTAAFLETADVSDIDALEELRVSVPQNAVGKLVTDKQWYYVTVVETDSIADLKEKTRVDVQFVYDFYESIPMTVSRIGRDEGGRCVLVLTTDKYIHKAVTSRMQRAEIVFRDRSGLRIPKTAIYTNDDGQPGVYVLEGIRAVWKPVTPLFDNKEYQIVVEDRSSTKNLWPGDEVILTAEPLFNGKVMGE